MGTEPEQRYDDAVADGLSHAEAQEEAWPERGPIFDEVPSGLSIMHWFIDKTLAREWVGCGGDADYILSWDPESESGSHLDLIAHVDHDDRWYWLLCVGTFLDGGTVTYDLLFVASNLDGVRSCEWRNEPSAEQPWHYEGLVWFAGIIETYEQRWHDIAEAEWAKRQAANGRSVEVDQ
jgi:hypothetical protein